jgi:competence protein ComEC
VLPVLAWHFQRAPATALAANALAAPLAEAVALPLVLAVGLLGAVVPVLGRFAGSVLTPVLDALFAMPGLALSLPGATASVAPPTPIEATVLVALVLWGSRYRWSVRLAFGAVALVVVGGLELGHRREVHPRGVLRVTAFDVGQGDAILVDLPDGAAMLVDGGGGRTDAPDPGERVVVPALADRRRRELAVMVATHPHPDHVGGLTAVLRWARVGELWDTRQGEQWTHGGGAWGRMRAAATERGVPVRGPETLCGPPRAFHGAVLEVLAPCPAVVPGTPPNDASLVFRLGFGRASALFAGDVERAGEAALVPRLARVTLLKVAHHGSRTSSTPAFLDALRPRVALVSAGHPSQFGHPHPDVLARLRAGGAAVWATPFHGAIAVTLRADGSYTVASGADL